MGWQQNTRAGGRGADHGPMDIGPWSVQLLADDKLVSHSPPFDGGREAALKFRSGVDGVGQQSGRLFHTTRVLLIALCAIGLTVLAAIVLNVPAPSPLFQVTTWPDTAGTTHSGR